MTRALIQGGTEGVFFFSHLQRLFKSGKIHEVIKLLGLSRERGLLGEYLATTRCTTAAYVRAQMLLEFTFELSGLQAHQQAGHNDSGQCQVGVCRGIQRLKLHIAGLSLRRQA